MKVIFSETTKFELDEACCFYDLEMPGLGMGFKEEVRKVVERISEFSTALLSAINRYRIVGTQNGGRASTAYVGKINKPCAQLNANPF